MSLFIGTREFLDCTECPKCKVKEGLKHGVRYGICGMGGNLVYLETILNRGRSEKYADQA